MSEFSRVISPDDHMAAPDPEAYFKVARSAVEAIGTGLEKAGRTPDSIGTLLDFGCGYGRVYRALVAEFPQAKPIACDLMEAAAIFCATTFGGVAVHSSEDLDDVRLPDKSDLVWLGSVFTHLPAHRWCRLLAFLAGATNPGGVVVFTSHGQRSLENFETKLLVRNPRLIPPDRFRELKRYLPTIGFDFVASPPAIARRQGEMGMKLTTGEYGFSFADPWWVTRLIESLPEWRFVSYVPVGWAGNHDVVTIRRA